MKWAISGRRVGGVFAIMLATLSAIASGRAQSSAKPGQAAPPTQAAAAPTASAIKPFDEIRSQKELDEVVMALDKMLFDAYNQCDLEKFKSMLADDVEFYHDNGGLTLGKDKLTQSIKDNICGGDVRRELVPGTFEAHHMEHYGAIEIGVHRFYHPKSNGPVGEGRFITLWQYKDGAWKITRALSFDHHQVK